MSKFLNVSLIMIFSVVLFSSCSTYNNTMREPNTHLELTKADFTLSEQVSAKAKSTKIIGIDFKRLFTKKTANIENDARQIINSRRINFASLPIIGNFLGDKTSNYALYELMTANPGYDVILYPQYEMKKVRPILGLGFLYKTTTVKTTARLGKLKK